jgi:hypothetical protein
MKNKYSKYFIIIFLCFITSYNYNSNAQSITYELSWLKYYEPNEGKTVGIWPQWSRWLDTQKLKELHYYKGFNYILSYPDFSSWDRIIESGYKTSEIMLFFDRDGKYVYQALGQFPQTGSYYIDEPADKSVSIPLLNEAIDFINTNFPGSPIVASGYKRNSQLISYTEMFDEIMFSSYDHWWNFLGFWVSCCPIDPDQRSDWTDMRNLFGSKFSMTWIGAHKDMSDYDELLGHAYNLGLSKIWLYQYDELSDSDQNIEEFCNNAVKHHFLKVYYQQVRDKKVNGQFVSRQFTGLHYASSIPSIYDHANLVFNNDVIINNHRVDDYYADNSITAGGQFSFIIPEDKSASFNTQNYIQLKPGFHAAAGSSFRAFIGD